MYNTICAISTSSGISAIGVIRISGDLVCEILLNLLGFCPADRVATVCSVKIKNDIIIDHCLVLFFKAPNSFTGEDLVELQCHGNERILTAIIEFVILLGARIAFPGEFIFRSFLNKKNSLLQVKATLKLLKSSQLFNFHVFTRILKLKKKQFISNFFSYFNSFLIKYEFYCEFNFTFNFLQKEVFYFYFYLLLFFNNVVFKFFKKFFVKESFNKIFFLGQPNVGKSSLMNFILKKQISIVSSLPGTTRDLIENSLIYANKKMYLFDTAGFKIGLCDHVEKIGISLTKKKIKSCQAKIVLILDISTSTSYCSNRFFSEIFFLYPYLNSFLIVINKIDVYQQCSFFLKTHFCPLVFISVKKKDGSLFLLKYFNSNFMFVKSFTSTRKESFNTMLSVLSNISLLLDFSLYLFKENKFDKSINLLSDCFKRLSIFFYLDSKEILDKIFSQFCIGK